MKKFISCFAAIIMVVLFLAACGTVRNQDAQSETESTAAVVDGHVYGAGTYQQISQEEAKQIMETEEGIITLDVRTQEEYDSGHIPGAVCLPNETIQEAWLQQQRVEDSGNSTNLAVEDAEPQQGIESFENSGDPELASLKVERLLPDRNQKILVYCRSGRRSKEAAQTLADMGYTNIFEFGGIIDWTGNIVTPELTSNIHLSIQGEELPVIWENNASVDELKQLVQGGKTIQMSMYGGFEQVGELGTDLARDDVQMTTEPGDIVLYSGNQIVIFYGSNSWAYTKLGKVNLPQEKLEELLGQEDVEISLFY